MGAGAAAATVVIAKRNELVNRFLIAGALSPGSARSPQELGVDMGQAWYSLERRGVIREAEQGRYYLEAAAWATERTRRQRALVVLLVVALAVLAVGVLLALRGGAPV